jgi:3-isopropylmalate dehydrogenase
MKARIAVLPGDGIGPEVVAQGVRCLTALARLWRHEFELTELPFGGMAIDAHANPLPEETLRACREADAVLLGAIGGPKWSAPDARLRPEQGLLRLRKELGAFANLRPVRVHPALRDASTLKPEAVDGVDLLFVRELTAGSTLATSSVTATLRAMCAPTPPSKSNEWCGWRRAWRKPAADGSLPSTRPTCWRPRVCGAR